MSRIISFVIGEAHCFTEWGAFRPEYRGLERSRYISLSTLPLLLVSATIEEDIKVKTTTLFGWATLDDFGPSLVMPNVILDRIIDCVHHNKIETRKERRAERDQLAVRSIVSFNSTAAAGSIYTSQRAGLGPQRPRPRFVLRM